MSERMPRRGLALTGLLTATLWVSGCTAPTPDEPGAATRFVTPPPPGGGPRTADRDDDVIAESEATAADLAFIDAMVAHHEQAVELTALAPERAADAELAELAGRMHAVQAAEAEAMRSWLDRRRTRDLPGDEHDHDETMRGEISRSTLDRAAELEGTAFDELFVDTMVSHHRGAIEMAEARLAEHGDPAVARWARAIATAQALEVDRLLEIEARLDAG